MTFPIALPIFVTLNTIFIISYVRNLIKRSRIITEVNLIYDLDHVELVFGNKFIRGFRDYDTFNLRFIPVFSEKKKFFDFYNNLRNDDEKKLYENDRLDLLFDTFPDQIDDLIQKGGYYKKIENDKRTYYLIKKNPEFVDKELFFNIMNGIMPDPIKTKVKFLEEEKEDFEDLDKKVENV